MSDWTLGVDVGARKIAIAAHSTQGKTCLASIVAARPELRDEAPRLADLYEGLTEAARDIVEIYPTLSVWVERPTGSFPNPALDHTVGVVMAAFWRALSNVYLHPVPVELISVGTWKKLALGYGNASKRQVLEWAHGQGYDRHDQDCADAFGIAYAGARYATWEKAA